MASFFDNKARAAAVKAGSLASSSKATKEQNNSNQPWVEKYRPKTLADITSQNHTTTLLQRTLRAPNLPHLLFYGPPGTGKTSTVLALSKQLFGPELFRTRVLELNASDERGISIVRTKIKDFARQQLSAVPAGPAGEEYRRQYPCPPFKIVVLDEADSMTQDAQSALRRTMETYSRITRFCLICNYVTRIIDPLASRCSKFRFKSLDSTDAKARVEHIASAEGVVLDDGAADALVKCADGDLRRAITFLQSAARLVGAGAIGNGAGNMGRGRKKKEAPKVEDDDDDDDAMDVDDTSAATSNTITVRIISEIAGVVPDAVINSLVSAILSTASPSYNRVSSQVTTLVADGWSATQLLAQLYAALIDGDSGNAQAALVSDRAKTAMLAVFAEADKRLVDGADEHLTVLDICLRLAGIWTESNGSKKTNGGR